VRHSATGSGNVDIFAEILNEDNEIEDSGGALFPVDDGNDYKLTIAGDCQEPWAWGFGEDFDLQITSPSATSSKTTLLGDLNDSNPPNINSINLEILN
jgi:hypothetical protein